MSLRVGLRNVPSSFAYNKAEFNYKMRKSRSDMLQAVSVREIHKPSWCATIPRGISSFPPEAK